MMLGHEPQKHWRQPVEVAFETPMLNLEKLSVEPNVRQFNLSVAAGSITALAGQIGSGASDVLRALAGLSAEAEGNVAIARASLPLGDPCASLRAGIRFVSADRKGEGLFLTRSIAENLVATRLPALSPWGYLSPRLLVEKATHIANNVGVDPSRLLEPVSQLSGGNQQKVFLGRCLERDDLRVLLLDEPTRGVDVGGRADIHRLIGAIAAKGITIVFASSDIDEILGLADNIVVMRAGRKICQRQRAATNSAQILSNR